MRVAGWATDGWWVQGAFQHLLTRIVSVSTGLLGLQNAKYLGLYPLPPITRGAVGKPPKTSSQDGLTSLDRGDGGPNISRGGGPLRAPGIEPGGVAAQQSYSRNR